MIKTIITSVKLSAAFIGLTMSMFLAMSISTAWAEDAETIQSYLDQTSSIQAEFKQIVHDEFGQLSDEKTGTVTILKPGQFLWLYNGKYPQHIGSNGQKVWIHDVALKQVTVRPIDQAMALSPAAILSGATRLTEVYNLTFLSEQEGAKWLRLTPLNGQVDTDYQDIQLAFRGEQLVAMRLIDNFGNINDIQFFEITVNESIDDDQFEIDVDDDVEVIGDL